MENDPSPMLLLPLNRALSARLQHGRALVRRLALWPVMLYRLCVSPLLPVHCRFYPSCSHYALDAVGSHGVLRGGLLTLRRLVRCHPWGGSGHDPVPPAPLSSLSSSKE